MEYREHRLPLDADRGRRLDPFIECVWFLSATPGSDAATPAATQRILPDGCAELIFHFRDRFHAVSSSGLQQQPAAFVVGLLTSPLVVAPGADVDTMAVRFRPGGAYPFFHTPMSALTDRCTSLADLWTPRDASRLWHQLAALRPCSGQAAHGDDRRAAIVARELQRRIAPADEDRVTSAAVAALVRAAGRARIDAVAGRTGTTPRQLQRRFVERVGVSPKALARILRFQRTLLQRSTGEPSRADWVRVAIECGYADQSHLIHDYAAFAGETPASLRAAEGELSAYFTAPRRLAAFFGLPSCIAPVPQKP
jgi:AraC-like DNA-binding protein